MATCFGRKQLFPTIKDVTEILTAELLEAAIGMTEIVVLFGTNFKFLKDDMDGNIKKITAKFEKDKEKFKTMQALLQDELDQKTFKDDSSGTVGGLWLKRGLEYVCEFFLGLVKDYEESQKPGAKSDDNVKKLLSAAYELTLTKHHGFASRLLMKGGMQFCPHKDKLMRDLAENKEGIQDQIIEELRVYENAMRLYVHQLGRLYQQFGYNDDLLRLPGGGDPQSL